MKKIVLLSTITATALFATNGDNLMALGAKARGMGGVGIATYFGAENALSNPAMIGNSKGVEFDFGATYFSPAVKVNGKTSKADTNMIPEVALSSKINDRLSFGIGMFGSAGMGVDFRDEPTLFKARTNLLLMKVAPTIAYKIDKNLAIGFSPVIQYGALDIAFKARTQFGPGVSDDFGTGFETGISYKLNNITLGAVYKSSIDMEYKGQINSTDGAASQFGVQGMSDHLEQPNEFGLGADYKMGALNFAFDYKKINWSSAKGYKEFKWDDQDVIALGAKYETSKSWYSVGYNYAKSPLKELKNSDDKYWIQKNTFNYLMFPATSETHYAVGYGRSLSKNFTFGLGAVISPKTSKTVTGTNGIAPTTYKTEHSETSYTVSFKYNF